MKKQNTRRGFTLIELLVVVLIIGILAAVALPQYQKTVEKSRSIQALTLIKAIGQAQTVHRLETGEYVRSLADLDVAVPCDGNGKWHTTGLWDTCSIGDWSLSIAGSPDYITQSAVDIGRWQGSYAGAGFLYLLGNISWGDEGTIVCVERRTSGVVFGKNKWDFVRNCQIVLNTMCGNSKI